MIANNARRLATQRNVFVQNNIRYFGVLPKLPKMELTMRTPYGTFFQDFSGFGRVYVGTLKGQMAISNKTIPRVYLLPPGQIKIAALTDGPGKVTKSDSGEFIHTGGWCFVHDNNSCEINMLECVEKEDFLWDRLDAAVETETDSEAGRVGATLQAKTVKILNRKR